MRSLLILVPALLMAQEPSKNPAAAADRAAESKSAAEFAESDWKLRPMLLALGVEQRA